MKKSAGVQTDEVIIFDVIRRFREEASHPRRTILNTDWDLERRRTKPEAQIIKDLVELIPQVLGVKEFIRNPFLDSFFASVRHSDYLKLKSYFADLVNQLIAAEVQIVNAKAIFDRFLEILKHPLVYFTPYWELEPLERYPLETYLFLYALIIDQTLSPYLTEQLVSYLFTYALLLERKNARNRFPRAEGNGAPEQRPRDRGLEDFDFNLVVEIDRVMCGNEHKMVPAEIFFQKFVDAWILWRQVPLFEISPENGEKRLRCEDNEFSN